jgi:regulator of protease activity HflC (stomatin/prohibitin superfamily)
LNLNPVLLLPPATWFDSKLYGWVPTKSCEAEPAFGQLKFGPAGEKPPPQFSGSAKAGYRRQSLMAETLWIVVLFVVVVAVLYKVLNLKRITIFEYQKGLKYSRGRFVGVLGPGQSWVLPAFTAIVPVDVRPEFITILGQDVLSADGVTLKVSLAAEFEVIDPNLAINKNANFRSGLYLSLQMALREIVGTEKIDDLMQNRSSIGTKLMERCTAKASDYGVKL